MNKIVVPEELKKQIVDLYQNKNYNRKQIKEKLNLPFGDSVILRILKENNILIRSNPGAKLGGRKIIQVSFDIQQQIIEKYQDGFGLQKIVNELSLPFGVDKVRTILKNNNILIRNVQESAQVKEFPDLRKYTINDNYNLESHNGAWILGFIAADGYLPVGHGSQNRIVITLARKDEEILYAIAKELEYTGSIKQFTNDDGYDCSSLNFTSKIFREKIEAYGIGNNKTFQLNKLPAISEEYLLDFIRGFIDGDGSILEPKGKKINISLVCASKNFLENITMYLNKKLNLNIPNIHQTTRIHTIYDIRYYTKDSFVLGKALYCNNFLALSRKKQHFLQILKKYS